ncbi:hypothetical protein BCR34DRAFT_616976 [Clohesyomyces aquaticus]|uniref:Uncharacterized protein n=1 Tax=Clohesyomyces aquaticus TaxID=1231657 RepID=A0A1Y1Z9E2_9PLEO|nr:hypothetical protein BCR34DRAFT_616976 [Clohesyomyces aquaticus]
MLPHPIDLWHETGYTITDRRVRRLTFFTLDSLMRTAIPTIALLRTCKLIDSEASPIFYSGHEFLSSGINGHMMAHTFLYTISKANIECLNHLTIAIPFHAYDRGIYGRNWSALSLMQTQHLQSACTFNTPPRPAWNRPTWGFREHVGRLFDILAKAKTLKALTLVPPEWFR